MKCRTLGATLLSLIVGLPCGSSAQTQKQCTDIATNHNMRMKAGEDACVVVIGGTAFLAKAAQDARNGILAPEAAVASVFSPRDLQRHGTQQPGLAGSVAQGQAIPSAQPTSLAAGSVALVGTKAGDDALAALGVNPAVLFFADTVSHALASASRLVDITFFVPASSATAPSAESAPSASAANAKLRYFGARVRVNAIGLSQGDAVWNEADRLARSWISNSGRNQARIQQALSKAADPGACVDTLLATADTTHVRAVCGGENPVSVDEREAERLHRDFAAIRRRADEKYLGLDIRVDVGDPTLGTVANASGRTIFAGGSWGQRFDSPTGTNLGVRASVGGVHTKVDSLAAAVFSVNGAAGLELARIVGDEEVNASAGVEFRQASSGTPADAFQTNFGLFRASMEVPLMAGNSVSISVGAPMWGSSMKPTLSVNFNWGLLLSATRPGG